MRVGLRIKKPFKQGKPDAYLVGQFVPDDHWNGWDAITIANRLKHEFVAWEPVPEDGIPVVDEPVIAELDKDGLILYAEARFGLKLDKRVSEKNMREQIGAMQQRADLLATNDKRGRSMQAARQGESAATVGAKPPVSTTKPAARPAAPAAVVVDEEAENAAGGAEGATDPNAGAEGATDETENAGAGNNPPAP